MESDGARPGLTRGEDGLFRCWWHGGRDDYVAYHDNEWGVPVGNDHLLFEKICLEGFQAGLSWLTILRKRDNFREAFESFDFEKIARFDESDVERLVENAGIVRHRGKIVSTINNAKRAIEMVDEEGSLAAYFWSFEPSSEQRPAKLDHATLCSLAKTDISTQLSKDLKKRGWSFVGPTTMYAFFQSAGIVNDHIEGCHYRAQSDEARAAFTRPARSRRDLS